MSEGKFDMAMQKAANWVAGKLAPGGFPTVPEESLYPNPSPEDPKPDNSNLVLKRLGEIGVKQILYREGTDHLKILEQNPDLWVINTQRVDEHQVKIILNPVENNETVRGTNGEFLLIPEIANEYANIDEIDLPEINDNGEPLFYRGISAKELDYIIQNQQIKGTGDSIHTGERETGTYLSTPIARRDALGYATKARITDQATLTQPKYLIATTISYYESIIQDELGGRVIGEVVVNSPIPAINIEHLYECRALSMRSGSLNLSNENMAKPGESTPYRAIVNYQNPSLPTAIHGIREMPLSSIGLQGDVLSLNATRNVLID